jgi:hypothetical protein
MEPQVIMDFITNQGFAAGIAVYTIVVVNKTLKDVTKVLTKIETKLEVKSYE